MSEYKGKDPQLAYEPADLGVDSDVEARSEKSPEHIEREIEQTRSRMTRNIDELGDRLSPSNLKQEAKTAIKDAAQGAVSNVGEQARRTGSRLVEVIRENPLPVIAVGAGVTWLLTQRSGSDMSGNRMARYAYTGPDRRGGRAAGGIKGKVTEAVSGAKDTISEAAGGLPNGPASSRTGPRSESESSAARRAGRLVGSRPTSSMSRRRILFSSRSE